MEGEVSEPGSVFPSENGRSDFNLKRMEGGPLVEARDMHPDY